MVQMSFSLPWKLFSSLSLIKSIVLCEGSHCNGIHGLLGHQQTASVDADNKMFLHLVLLSSSDNLLSQHRQIFSRRVFYRRISDSNRVRTT
jgi:hypothetical protein